MKSVKRTRLPGAIRLALRLGLGLALLLGLAVAVLGTQRVPLAHAQTLTVCGTGCDYTKIQLAINDASNGDIISVVDAVHTEAGIVVRKNVTIQGQGPGNTIVQAQTLPDVANTRVFAINNAITTTIRDMTIRHGNVVAGPAQGGGIYNNGALTVQRVTITGNRAVGSGNDEEGRAYGGGIYNDGTLILQQVAVIDNWVEGNGSDRGSHAQGGGIYNNGTLTIQDSSISDNTAQGGSAISDIGDAGNAHGGGIYNNGTLTVQLATIIGNRLQGGYAGGQYGGGGSTYGGGIYNNGGLSVQDSAISSNTLQGGNAAGSDGHGGDAHGGGVAQWWPGPGSVTLAHSIISRNMARGGNAGGANGSAGSAYGGGVSEGAPGGGTLAFINCTISANTAQGGLGSGGSTDGDAEGGGIRGSSSTSLSYCTVAWNRAAGALMSGGGLHSTSGLGSGPWIKSCIVANNTGPSDPNGPDLAGNVQSQDYNLIENANGHTLSGTTGNNIEGADPLLGPLQDNGGPTETHALPESSPSLNRIPNGQNECGTTITEDQRGSLRPQGGTCDMGAFELELTGLLEVVKELVPSADWGTFHLQIDGVIEKADASDGDSTGKKLVYTGAHTVAESTDIPDELDKYNILIECRDQGGAGSVVATIDNAGPLALTVNRNDDIVCIITNVRKTGKLEVSKALVPGTDPGLFDLRIDGEVEKANASDGDSTGKKTVYTGVRTVGETTGTSTDLDDYNSSIECRADGGQGDVVASATGTGPLPVTVNEDDDIACTVTNVRKTGKLELVKDLEPDTNPGKFLLQIDGVTWRVDASDGESTGKVVVNTGERLVRELGGTDTTLYDYNSSIECRDSGGQGAVVASSSDSGPLPVQVNEDDDIVCTFTNVRKTGYLEIIKDLEPADNPGKFHLQIDGITMKGNASDGDTTEEQMVDTGQRTVGEVAGLGTTLADYNSSIECRDQDGAGSVVGSTNGPGPLVVAVYENDDIVCTITNVRKTGKLEVFKDLEPDSDPGRFNLQIDGVTERVDAGDMNSTGQQTVNTGEHLVGETAGTDTDLSNYESSIECRDNGGGGIVVASSNNAGPLTVTVDEHENIVCTIRNNRQGSITIIKEAQPTGPQKFFFDGDLGEFFLRDRGDDTNTTTFLELRQGSYEVGEIVPAGWYLTDIVCQDPDGGSVGAVITATALIDLDAGEEVTCTFHNAQLPDLFISKGGAPTSLLPGQPLTYTLSFSNTGSVSAPNVLIADVVPGALTDVRFESDPALEPVGSISYTWDVGGLDPGDGGVITITGRIRTDLVNGLTFTNTASITTPVAEWNPSNNSDSMPVTVVRLAPLAVDDFYRTRPNVIFESSPLSVLDNDNDQQSDPLTAMLGDEPDNGDVILNLDGTFVYTPTLDFAGEDTFTYHASDGVLDSNVATVTIAVGAHRVYLPMVIRQYP
jgi:uncharacterized repeat protein (TIGR01451 family)